MLASGASQIGRLTPRFRGAGKLGVDLGDLGLERVIERAVVDGFFRAELFDGARLRLAKVQDDGHRVSPFFAVSFGRNLPLGRRAFARPATLKAPR